MKAARATALLERLGDLTPDLRQRAREADRLARLPDDVARLLLDHGYFRLWIPRRYSGFELDLPAALEIYEAAAHADGSVGWSVMIGSGGGLFAAFLDAVTAAEIFARPDAVIAGSGAPDGCAERIDGGYRVTGRWRYASGAHYATTFTANCAVTDGGKAVRGSDGQPLVRAMAFEPSQVVIRETWDASGMRGTGSHDIEVSEAFVPTRRSFSVFTDPPREPGPLYRLPFAVLTELPVAAVAVGIACHALEAFAELARRKAPAGSSAPLTVDPVVQARYAESHSTCQLARAALHALAQDAWQSAALGRSLELADLAAITAGCAWTVARLRQALADLAAFAGMTATQQDCDFARAWRDLQTLSAHVAVSPRQLASAGAALLAQVERSGR